MVQIGLSLEKTSRKNYTSSPPKKDLPMTVTPLGDQHKDPYVAEVDGSHRILNEDEMLNWRRKNRWAVKRMVLHRISERRAKQSLESEEDGVSSQVNETTVEQSKDMDNQPLPS